MVEICSRQFAVDWWEHQTYRPEVWVEKDALIGVLEVACEPWRCPYFSCRGYTSDSEIWSAARRLAAHFKGGQTPIVFHLGDHDPSGIDMSRDILDRVRLFANVDGEIEVRRLALNMPQIEELRPPPNPAKSTDSRYTGYRDLYGDESWELDALNPEYITDLIRGEMETIVDRDAWGQAEAEQEEGRRLLAEVAANWEKVTKKL